MPYKLYIVNSVGEMCYLMFFYRCIENGWAYSQNDIINSTNSLVGYTTSFYFGTTTMTQTGFGDILPNAVSEHVLIILTMALGFIVWNICVITITAFLINRFYSE